MTIVCPKCGKDDQIRKVTSIVTEGSTGMMYSDVLGTLAGTGSAFFQTALAQRLRPPSQPKKPKKSDYMPRTPRRFFVFLFLNLPLSVIILALLSSRISVPDNWVFGLICLFGWALLASVLFVTELYVGAILLGWRRWLALFLGMDERYQEARKQAERDYQGALRLYMKWPEAIRLWNNLYYCSRDDIVFVPGKDGFASPEQLHIFLYQ